ncbi:MAG: selenium cofactor biosynthesis protein YqeC [Dehalococcoidales bacterium]|nr:selenium cofactor biosynthesis protein YqeC [Dehalococcoidales bacterium]
MADNCPVTPAGESVLSVALGISPKEIISLVGGGGKSTLMRKLALELAGLGYKVITTTTTHILPDQAIGCFIMEKKEAVLLERARLAISHNPVLTLACGQETNGKLKGPDPVLIPKLLGFSDFVIVEADGAQRKPLKAPNGTEPVIIPETTTVIAMVGIDGVGKTASEVIFRHEIAGRLTGLAPDDTVTTQAVVKLLVHPDGITRTSPAQSRKIVFINKVETGQEASYAEEIAMSLKRQALFSRVIIGKLEGDRPSIRMTQINNSG